MSKRDYDRLSMTKFILAVMVVILHNDTKSYFKLNGEGYWFIELVTHYMYQVAVPIFFFISAALLFRHIDGISNISSKVVSRIKKLTIPFLFWRRGCGQKSGRVFL